MKQAIIMIVLAIITLPAIGQDYQYNSKKDDHLSRHRIFVTSLAQEFDGYVLDTQEKSMDLITFKISYISVPDFYDNDLAITIINRWARSYSDVTQAGPWERTKNNTLQVIYYFKDTTIFMFFEKKKLTVSTVIQDLNVYE